MKKLLLVLVSLFMLVVAAPAVAAPTPIVIDVTFNADGSATITSSQGISNFTVTLCSGPLDKVELPVGSDERTITVGPFDEDIVSIRVKSGTQTSTFTNPDADCEPGEEIPESPLSILLPLSVIGSLAIVGTLLWRRRGEQL